MTGKEEDAEAGYLRFYDAWLLPDSLPNSLCPDVMTPHHSGYYTGEGAPTDFDDPNPVTFLSVRGSFEVRVGCEDPDPEVRRNGRSWRFGFWERPLSAVTRAGRPGRAMDG